MLSGRTGRSVAFALAAAALYALSTPFSKVLLADISPKMMAALLYLGAGAGMTVLSLASGARGDAGEVRGRPLERADAPYVAAMVVLDVAAPLLLMAGLSLSSAESVSLLNNFEIVATALIARLAFGERVGARTATGIGVISLACVLLSWDAGAWGFSAGSLLTLAACLCWGIENNCTNRLSGCDPARIVIIKGWGSGAGALIVALGAGQDMNNGIGFNGAEVSDYGFWYLERLTDTVFTEIIPRTQAKNVIALTANDIYEVENNSQLQPRNHGRTYTSATNRSSTLALTEDGKLYSWGSNRDGTIGNGMSGYTYVPLLMDISLVYDR